MSTNRKRRYKLIHPINGIILSNKKEQGIDALLGVMALKIIMLSGKSWTKSVWCITLSTQLSKAQTNLKEKKVNRAQKQEGYKGPKNIGRWRASLWSWPGWWFQRSHAQLFSMQRGVCPSHLSRAVRWTALPSRPVLLLGARDLSPSVPPSTGPSHLCKPGALQGHTALLQGHSKRHLHTRTKTSQ